MAINTSHPAQIATSSRSRSEVEAKKVCFHEAGHAVAAHILGFPVIWVSVDRSFIVSDSLAIEYQSTEAGALCMTNSFDRLGPILNRRAALSKYDRETVICPAIMLMAGLCAERKLDPVSFDISLSQRDFDALKYIFDLAEPDNAAFKKILDTVRKRSPEFVDTHWKAITLVGNELYLRKTLLGSDLDEIIGRSEIKTAA